MRFSYNWLKELSKTNKTATEIADLFLTHSFEVEDVEDLSQGLNKVIVGEVLSIEKHPDADRLQVAKVDVGKNNGGTLQIVCGAPNLQKGQKVPVALPGAEVIFKNEKGQEQKFKIKESKIRGVESFGMICAEDELGLGEDHSGIMVLPDDAPVGDNLARYLHLDDQVLEIDILPNRAHDCLSHQGVARELCALENREFSTEISEDDFQKFKEKLDPLPSGFSVQIETPHCSRYCLAKLSNIQIKPSPLWLQAKLKISGLKPINNVVDITNYVMLKTGQPLHAFSAEKIDKIVVREAKEEERIVLLDGRELELSASDLVIADGKSPIALAGIMGGLESGVKNETTEVLLEGANFNAPTIRLTARRHNLQTDASYRFERDIDPNFVGPAIVEAVNLLQKYADAKLEFGQDFYPQPVKPWSVDLTTDYVSSLLGINLSKSEIKSILNRLGIQATDEKKLSQLNKNEGEKITFLIPTARRDLRSPEDLIEEVGRVYGYDKIKPKPPRTAISLPKHNRERMLERKLKEIMVANGFYEIRSYSFYSRKDAKMAGLNPDKHIALLNPANPEQQILRNNLIINLLKAGQKNLSYFPQVQIFEEGKIYKKSQDKLPDEELRLALAVFSRHKQGEQFYQVKGVLDNLLETLNITSYYYDDNFTDIDSQPIPKLNPVRRALLKTKKGEVIGWLGEISGKVAKDFGLKNVRVAVGSLDVRKILKLSQTKIEFKELPKFPFVERDISLLVDKRLQIKKIEEAIHRFGGELLKKVELFDIYNYPEKNEKSLAFHLAFGSPQRTLRSEEVDELINKLIDKLEKNFSLKVRR